MFSKALLAASIVSSASAAFSISTPCQPASLSWSGSDSTPFILAAIPGGQPAAAALANIGSTSSSPYAWTVNVAAGTTITLKVTDNQGNIAYSSEVTVQQGPTDSCLSSGSGSGSSSGGASSAASSAAAVTTGNTGTTGTAAGGAAVNTATTAKTSSSSGAAAAAAASGSNSAAAAASSKAAAGRSTVVGGALGAAGLMVAAAMI